MNAIVTRKGPRTLELDERAQKFARSLQHTQLDAGHYLYALATSPARERHVHSFNVFMDYELSYIRSVMNRSMLSDGNRSSRDTLPLTQAGETMMKVASFMALKRHSDKPEPAGAKLHPNDFVVGVLLSGSESVDTIVRKQGVPIAAILRARNIVLPPQVSEMLVRAGA